ncbi:MAG: hypothetical protein WD336_00180 [Trueperaceae bacterium]
MTEYALPGEGVFPEGIAYHADSDSVYVTGAASGALYRIDLASGDAEVVLEVGTRSPFGTLGLAVDGNDLWIAGGNTGEILRMNMEAAEIEATYATPEVEATLINDLIVAPNGDVYVTDSFRPTLFKIAAGSDEVEAWRHFGGTEIEYGEGVNLNGIVVSDDGAYLVVVHMTEGALYRIHVASRAVHQIDLGGDTVPGGDGLALDGTTLYVVQNGPDEVSVVELADDFASGTLVRILEDDRLADAATGALAGSDLLVTNAQFSAMQDEPTLPFTVTVVLTE